MVISATYPGADAETLQNSVTQVIEQQLTGLDHLLYFSSTSERRRLGRRSPPPSRPAPIPTSPRCRCRTRCSRPCRCCPPQVQQQGVVVAKATPNFLLIVGLYDDTGR